MQEIMETAINEVYKGKYSGEQVDEAISKALESMSSDEVETLLAGILEDYVKFTNYPTSENPGVVCSDNSYGVEVINENKVMAISKATEQEINAESNHYKPIVPENLNYAMKLYGIESKEMIPDMQNNMRSYLNLSVKSICPANEVIFDNEELPGIYVQRAPRKLSELVTDGNDSVHPAFLVESQQITKLLIGKFQGKRHNNRIYSLPGEDPTASITLDTYEIYCKNKGSGHHCITAAEWAFLALCAKKDGKMPKGNNNYGKDTTESAYAAIPSMGKDSSGRIQRVATGTGSLTWSDTDDLSGIWDLNGNVWEWVSGIRLVKGELQLIPYNNAARSECDTSASSSEWRAVNADAAGYDNLFITPDGSGTTTNSVKLDYVSSHWQWQAAAITNAADEGRNALFADTTMSGLSSFCKMFMRAMALAPDGEASEYEGDKFYANNMADERCTLRGGGWNNGANAGLFALYFSNPRSNVSTLNGGRPAYYETASV